MIAENRILSKIFYLMWSSRIVYIVLYARNEKISIFCLSIVIIGIMGN